MFKRKGIIETSIIVAYDSSFFFKKKLASKAWKFILRNTCLSIKNIRANDFLGKQFIGVRLANFFLETELSVRGSIKSNRELVRKS